MQSAVFELVLKYFYRTVSLSVLITKFPGGRAAPGSPELAYSSWQQLEISWTQSLVSQEGRSLDTESGGIFSLVGSLGFPGAPGADGSKEEGSLHGGGVGGRPPQDFHWTTGRFLSKLSWEMKSRRAIGT